MEVAEKIIKKGNIELPQEYRDEEVEKRKKQIIDFYLRNAIDSRSNRPFTPEIIEASIKQSGVNITNKPVDQQISNITESLKTIIPLKIETKKIIITIPAVYTGKVYGVINEYKEKEDWLSDGSLKVVVSIPVGLQSEFYDKLNAITHGAAITEETKE
jgi:ribosome maturation protein SDO1